MLARPHDRQTGQRLPLCHAPSFSEREGEATPSDRGPFGAHLLLPPGLGLVRLAAMQGPTTRPLPNTPASERTQQLPAGSYLHAAGVVTFRKIVHRLKSERYCPIMPGITSLSRARL